MSSNSYSSLNDLNSASSQKIVVRRIQRIIEKYAEVWRVLHEPVQNSIDAIQQREDITEGNVSIEINLGTGSVIVSDNGKGFPQSWDLLLPDGTDKTEQSDTMGYQGVGLKSVIYTSHRFSLISNTGDGNIWGAEIKNAKKYLESDGQEIAPIDESIDRDQGDQGTTIEVEFDPVITIKAMEQIIDSVISADSNFQWPWSKNFRETNFFLKKATNNIDIFERMLIYYLKTHTYVGSVNRLLHCRLKPLEDVYAKKVEVQLSIKFSNIDINNIENDFFRKVVDAMTNRTSQYIEVKTDNKFMDFQQIVKEIEQENQRDIPFIFYDFNVPEAGIYQQRPQNSSPLMSHVYCKIITPDYTADERETRYAQYISLLKASSQDRTKKNIRIFSKLFPKILGIYVLIGRMDYYGRFMGNNYGIKLISANGIPTQHELTARSSNQSFYFNPITFILNVDGKLNEGKTHLIDSSLERQCVKFFREAFESTLNRLAQEFVGSGRRSRSSPIEPELVDIPKINMKKIDIRREPRDENTLIVLFYQFLNIKGVRLPTYALLQNGIFDGKFTYRDENIRSPNDLMNIEFKVELSQLLDDFENPNSPKEFDDCHLIVVWSGNNIRSVQQQDWRVINRDAVSTSQLSHSETPDWIVTLLRRGRTDTYRPIIIVEDWVKEHDPDFTRQNSS